MGSVSVLLVRPLAAALGSAASGPSGPDGPGLLRAAAGISPELLADDDGRIAEPRHVAAWAGALHASGDPRLPLRIAAELPPGALGLGETVCRAAPTLGEALRRWVRLLNLLDDTVEMDLEVEEDRAVVSLEGKREEAVPAADELRLAMIARLARELPAAPVRPVAVDFTHAGPDAAAPLAAWFEAPVAFGAEVTRLVLPREALAARLAPPAPADPAPLAILARAADDLAAAAEAEPPVTRQVKRALPEALTTDDAQVEAIAKQLGLAVRSLQRRLKDEGTSFQVVREDVRRALALRYVDAGLAAVQIAFLLGFDEPAAFLRAFKRWTGVTPAERRAGPIRAPSLPQDPA